MVHIFVLMSKDQENINELMEFIRKRKAGEYIPPKLTNGIDLQYWYGEWMNGGADQRVLAAHILKGTEADPFRNKKNAK